MAPQIQDPTNDDEVILKSIVDGVWESPGEEAMMPEDFRVNTCVESEGVDIGEQGVKEVLTQSLSLFLVE